MAGDDVMRLVYLILLGSAVAGWVLIESRGRMGQAVRQGLAWLLIVVGLAAGYGLWQERALLGPQQTAVVQNGQIVVPRGPDNHFYLRLEVDGTPVRFMIDTGASNIVLAGRDADRLGIDRRNLAYLGTANTANGRIRTAMVTLPDVRLQGEPLGTVTAWVGDGPLDVSLLGMEFLNRFAKVELERNRLILSH